MTPAAKLQEYIKKRVQGSGGSYRKVRWEARSGCPDCFIWWQWPQAAFIEVKAGRDRLSPMQAREIERMKADGVPVYVVSTVEDVDVVLSRVKNLLQS